MRFEWDARKADENFRKHRVSFDEASSVFEDPLGISYPDPDHSGNERRFIIFGFSSSNRLLVVSYAERDDTLRIINARRATRSERNVYEEG